jgi:hypothetical protein
MPALDREVADLRRLVDRSLSYRVGTAALAQRLRGKISRRQAMSGGDLADLKKSEAEHLALRASLIRIAAEHECWLDGDSVANGSVLPSAERLKGLMLSVAAALVLYDNYLLAMSLYQDSAKLRRYLDNRDIGFGIDYGELNRASLSFLSVRNRRRVRAGLAYYEREAAPVRWGWASDDAFRYLDLVITQSPSYNLTRRPSLSAYLGDRIEFFGLLTSDSLMRLRDEGVNLLSMVFGDTIGLVESRRGRLYARPAVQAELERTLQAGDILLEKTPFRLTDAVIPGYWGHSAILVGTEAELRELAIWDDPVVVAQHAAIRQHRLVAEALRSGVKLNPLRRFLNVDDLAVLRMSVDARRERAAAIVQALRQVGKRYDFNFDIETTDRIVCSELIYNAYATLDWPTSRLLGRSTISPDDIAAKALGGRAMTVLVVYHDGQRMSGDPADRLGELMRRRTKRPAGVFPGPNGDRDKVHPTGR